MPLHRRNLQPVKKMIDPFPELNGFIVGDEIGATAHRFGTVPQRALGQEMSINHVVDMGEVDPVSSVSDNPEPTVSRAGDDSRDQVGVAGAPDQVGPQCHGPETTGIVRPENGRLGPGLGPGVMHRNPLAEGKRLIGTLMGSTVEDDTGRTGEDHPWNLKVPAAIDQGLGALHIGRPEVGQPAPDPHFGADVKDRSHALAGGPDGGGIGQIHAQPLGSAALQVRNR